MTMTMTMTIVSALSDTDFAPREDDVVLSQSAAFDADKAFLFEGLTPRFATRVVRSCIVTMRDGVRLSTDLHIPLGARLPLPVILSRTPYDKRTVAPALPAIFPEQGFVYAIQDVRGRCESEGEFVACTGQDRDDGFDTVSWLAAQPWCNGRIGAIGSSYVGETTAKLAATRHPNYAAGIVMFDGAFSGGRHYNGAFMQSGVALLRSLFDWLRDYVPKISYGPPVWMDRQTWFRSPAARLYATQPVHQPEIDIDAVMRSLPVADMLDATGAAPSEFAAFMRENAQPGGDYWRSHQFLTDADSFAAPALIVTGNEDTGGSGPDNFRLFRERATTDFARDNQYLLFAAAPHSGHVLATERTIRGARDFGDTRFPYFRTFVDWFGRWLRDDPNEVEQWPKARFYVSGRNAWDSDAVYPPADVRPARLYLNGGDGRYGTLTSTPPVQGTPPARFRYDAADPTPSDLPGVAAQIVGVGFADRSSIERRDDVLVYSSAPLAAPLEIAGRIEVILSVSSSAPDTDFVAVLHEVDDTERAINITHGIVRMRWRDGYEAAKTMEPDEIYTVSIDLWFANLRFAAGSRIRLHIASAHFPYFDRNLNTGEDNYTTTRTAIADNAVHHDASSLSYLVLPVRGAMPTI